MAAKRPGVVLGLLTGSFLVAVLAGELAVRQAPLLLPGWYRESYPMHGVEFFYPGLLARTPVDSFPLPIVAGGHDGQVPADLKLLGVVPVDIDVDDERFPRLVVPADSLGLPNPVRPRKTDVVLVGDSFLVSAGSSEPVGLRKQLADASGLDVYDCSYAGIGPVRELALFEQAGLPLAPDAVIWFFFGGNDIVDSMGPAFHRMQGMETYGDVFADRATPTFILFDVVRTALGKTEKVHLRAPLVPLVLPSEGGAHDVWLHPSHLTQTLWTESEWKASPGWAITTDVLRRAQSMCAERGARFLVVYLPTKTEVYLPYVEPDAELVHGMASFHLPAPHDMPPQELLRRALAGRSDLAHALDAFCAEAGIDFLSALPLLEAMAARGELAYLVADSHWHPEGQRVLVPPLLEWLSEGAY